MQYIDVKGKGRNPLKFAWLEKFENVAKVATLVGNPVHLN